MVDFLKHQQNKFIGNEREYIERFLSNDKTPWTYLLEQEFAKRFKVKYAIAISSGTSALHTCLLALGVGQGDEVISSALTVVMDAFATKYVGAKPVYADVDPCSFNIYQKDIINKYTHRTKAIIAVSLYGLPCDIKAIMDTRVSVIEDNAQCLTSECKADMSIFSFERTKHLGIGEGGMVTTNNPVLAIRVRKFAGLGYKDLEAEQGRMQVNPSTFQDPDYKRHDTIGYNYRMPEICAAVGLARLERIDEIIKERQEIARMYNDAIKGCNWLIPQMGQPNSYYTYAVRYLGVPKWKEFYTKLIELGGDGFYAAWSLPYKEPALYDALVKCPVAEKIQPQLMQFKTNYRDKELAEFKIDCLRRVIEYFG